MMSECSADNISGTEISDDGDSEDELHSFSVSLNSLQFSPKISNSGDGGDVISLPLRKPDEILLNVDSVFCLLSSNLKLMVERELNSLIEVEKELSQRETNLIWENECLRKNKIISGPPVVNYEKNFGIQNKIDDTLNLLSSNLKLIVEKETKPLRDQIDSLIKEAIRLGKENEYLESHKHKQSNVDTLVSPSQMV